MSSADPKATLRLARAYAAKHLPWFAPALYRCEIIMTAAVTVAAIDNHYNIYWNAESVDLIQREGHFKNRYLEELAFIWIHEISHVLREHNQRRDTMGADPSRWNCCADLEINDSRWPGTRPPTPLPPVTPKLFDLPNGRLAEWYYRQEATQRASGRQLDCGSGAHGKARPWELGDLGQRLNDTEREVIKRSVAQEMSKYPGMIPGNWKVWVDQTLHPAIEWRQLLRQRLASAIALGSGARVDYSFRRPGRRQSIYQPLILPTLSGSARSQLAVVIDTSGSMAGQPLGQAVAELYGILTTAHQQVSLIPCDATSYDPIPLQSALQLQQIMELPGGGGTDMRQGIKTALESVPGPDCILVLTDGYTPYPAQRPKVPLIFGILSAGERASQYQLPPNPPWTQDQIVQIPIKG